MLFNASYDVSFAFPQSTTKTTSLMVMLVSAMFVASTIFLTPSSGLSNINFCLQTPIGKQKNSSISKHIFSLKSDSVTK